MTNLYLSVRDFGAVGDGVADDSAAILAAVNQANANAGGVIFFPSGIYLTGTIPLYSNVHFLGAGEEASVLRLKPALNSDMFQGLLQGYSHGVNGYSGPDALVNIAAPGSGTGVAGTGSNAGVNSFTIRSLTLDGNATAQTGYGAAIRVYGYGFRLQNLYIRNCSGDGIYVDWNPNVPQFGLAPNQLESLLQNVKVHDIGYGAGNSTSMGIRWAGGTDCQWDNVVVYRTGSHSVHIGPNASALQVAQLHAWGMANGNAALGVLCEASGCMFTNCEVEGSDLAQVALLSSNTNWIGGRIFGGGAPGSSYGIQLGQATGDTPYVGSCLQTNAGSLANPASPGAATACTCSVSTVKTYIQNTFAGAVYFRHENNNIVEVLADQLGTTAMLATSGIPDASDRVSIKTHNIASAHTLTTSGAEIVSSDSNVAFRVSDGIHDTFTVDNSNGPSGERQIAIPGAKVSWFGDYSYQTETARLDHNGTLFLFASGMTLGSNSAAQVVGNNSTVLIYNSAAPPPNWPQPAVAFHYGKVRVTATIAATGLVLQGGVTDGTETTIVNESAFKLTFAHAGSRISIPSYAIPVGAARKFIWNLPKALWYPQS